jgi:hypothetical protein
MQIVGHRQMKDRSQIYSLLGGFIRFAYVWHGNVTIRNLNGTEK